MSLQDNYFDVKAALQGKPEGKLFEEIWDAYCDKEKDFNAVYSAFTKITDSLKLIGRYMNQ